MGTRLSIPGAGYAWMVAGILWLWTFWACAGEWRNTDAYSYGFFVPVLGGYFFWRRWQELKPVLLPDQDVRLAWGILFLVVAMAGPIELLRQTPLYWRPVLWGMGMLAVWATVAAAFLTGGSAGVRGLLFPACFPLIGIPWPGQVEIGTTVALQGWVAMATGDILNWLGVGAVVDGKIIRLSRCVLGVEEACSGLQGLQSSLMVALAGGEIFRRGGKTRLALVAWGVSMALIGNLVRAVILGLIGARLGPEKLGFWHNFFGMGILMAVVWVVWWAAAQGNPATSIAVSPKQNPLWQEGGKRTGFLVLAWLIISGICVYWWYAQPTESPRTSLLIPRAGVLREPVPKEVLQVLRPSEGIYLRAGNSAGYHFWWKPGRGKAELFYHRPESCMPGVGWKIARPASGVCVKIQGVRTYWTIFHLERLDQKAMLLWATWMDGRSVPLDEFEVLRAYYFERERIFEFIRNRQSTFSFEVAACLIPGSNLDEREMGECLNQMFQWRQRDGVR